MLRRRNTVKSMIRSERTYDMRMFLTLINSKVVNYEYSNLPT